MVCEGRFSQAPTVGGPPYNETANGVSVNTDGTLSWSLGDMNSGRTYTTLTYGHGYHHGNWTIYADETGTKFTNDRTGHGMFVSIENVYAF